MPGAAATMTRAISWCREINSEGYLAARPPLDDAVAERSRHGGFGLIMERQSATAAKVSPFFSNDQAATYLNLSPRTLEKLRVVGGGPAFRKFGRRVTYALDDLEAWAAMRRCDSTSDTAWRRAVAGK